MDLSQFNNERNIRMKWVQDAIASPDRIEDHEDGAKHYRYSTGIIKAYRGSGILAGLPKYAEFNIKHNATDTRQHQKRKKKTLVSRIAGKLGR